MSQGTPISSMSTELVLVEKLLTNTIVKRYKYALSKETNESVSNYLLYKEAFYQRDTLYSYTFEILDLVRFAYLTPIQRQNIVEGRINPVEVLTKSDAEILLETKRNNRIKSYVEINEYYREIMGLPPIDMNPKNYIYITDVKDVDPDTPIHELPIEQWLLFKNSLKFNIYREKYIKDHPYIDFIWKEVDLITAREADPYQVISYDKDSISIGYVEFYEKERNAFYSTYHNTFRFENYYFYESSKIIELKLAALVNWRLNYAINFLDSNTYTNDEATTIWNEFNLSIPEDMPTQYRDTITFLLNYLHTFKGTNFIIQDVAENIFGNMEVFKYFICKKLKSGVTLPIPEGTDPRNVFDIFYIKVPFNARVPSEGFTSYEEIQTYEEISRKDPKWFEEDKEVIEQIYHGDYSYLTSKYLSVSNYIDITNLSLKISILSRLIIRHKKLTKEYKIYYKETKTDENLFDLWCYINAISSYAFSLKDNIIDSIDKVLWLIGFRTPEDLQILQDLFLAYFRYTKYKDLLNDFPTMMDNETFKTFLEKANKSIGIAKILYEMLEFCDDWFQYDMILKIYEAVILCEKTPELYELPTGVESTYTQYLRAHSPVLYKRLIQLISLNDHNTLIVEIDFLLSTISEEFKKYVSEDSDVVTAVEGLKMILSSLVEYLAKILNIFKDHSAELMNISMVYKIEGNGNFLRGLDEIKVHLKDIKFKDYSIIQPNDKVYVKVQPENPNKRDRLTTIDFVMKDGAIINE